MNWIKTNFDFFAITFVAVAYLLLSNTYLFESNFSILERSSFALIACLILMNFNPNSRGLVISVPLILLVLFCGISISHFLQEYVAKDFIGLVFVAVLATLIANQFSPIVFLKGLLIGGLFIALWSVSLVLFLPLSAFANSGQLIGPFTHWNSLGLSLLPGVAVAVSLTKQTLLWNVLRFSYLAIAGWVLFLSQSRTSWIVALGVLVLGAITLLPLKYKKSWFMFWGLLTLLIAIAAFNFSTVLNFLGKDSSLTGRTQIWQSVFAHSLDGGIIGNGWVRVFPTDYPVYIDILTEQNLRVFHAHNDLLQWLVSAGIISVLLVVFSYFVIIKSAIYYRTALSNEASIRWLLLGASQLILSGLTEPSTYQMPGWFIFCLLITFATIKKSDRKSIKSRS